jgi:SAM-dependent methyltransferase
VINEFAIQRGGLIWSKYRLADQVELLVGSAADRSYTRLMLSEEFQNRKVKAEEGYALWAGFYNQERNPLIGVEGPVVDALLADLTFVTALDAGAGTGRHALKLARRGARMTALDQSPEMLAVAQQTAEAEGLSLDFRLGSLGEPLPFEANQFDLVVCTLVLCHLPDLSGPMNEFFRVTHKGGYLLISDFHPDIARREQIGVSRPEATYLLPNAAHPRTAYLEAVEQAGFSLLKEIDVPIRNIPEGYMAFREVFVREQGENPLCLILLAQK